jgi:hypothetical protein
MERSQRKGNMQDVDGKGGAMHHRRLWILLASIVSFFVAFLWLDFRLAASRTESEKNITTTSLGLEAIVPKYQGPVLIAKVGRPGSLWMPFFVTSQVTVQTGYSSSGNNALLGETQVAVNNAAGPVITMYGEYKVNDRSWGLISRPGYYHMLADYLAQQIVATLKDLYRMST